jgi:hypothetical protein
MENAIESNVKLLCYQLPENATIFYGGRLGE